MRPSVELFVDLDAVEADAGGALDREGQASLYDTIEWFRLTERHIERKKTALLAARARIGDAGAWLFLAVGRARGAEAFGSWYTLRFAPIFAGAPADGVKTALVGAIARALKPRLARISLHPVAQADCALLQRGFGEGGWLTGSSPQTTNWVAHTGGDDFAAYWAKRPGQLRNTARRKAAKAKLEITLLDRFDDGAWDAYEQVFAASWKGEEGSPAFLRAIAQRASDWGSLRMALAHDGDGTPLAAQFWTIDRDVATIHKLAYADAAKALSPGTVLSHAMFEHVIERDRPAVIDFGTGDDPYKAEWMDEKRVLYRFEAYHPGRLRGLAAYTRAKLATLAAYTRSD